ncbi:hypothetical protein IJG72_01530 [bacterium]|nr:hypothetical protein [bacterium]
MSNSYNNSFNNPNSSRSLPIIKERVSLISAEMYKRFCLYQHANENTSEIFAYMAQFIQDLIENLKQSFAARNVATENIWAKFDTKAPAIIINILWQQYSFTMRCNFKPQVLYRENDLGTYTGRIMAIKGNYFDVVSNAKTTDDEMAALLDNEIASLYVPSDKMKDTILKPKHSASDYKIKQIDAGSEFPLKITEAICGSTIYHEEGSRKSFNI